MTGPKFEYYEDVARKYLTRFSSPGPHGWIDREWPTLAKLIADQVMPALLNYGGLARAVVKERHHVPLRRLADLVGGLACESKEEILDALRAGQSLDDLGTEARNKGVMLVMATLEARLKDAGVPTPRARPSDANASHCPPCNAGDHEKCNPYICSCVCPEPRPSEAPMTTSEALRQVTEAAHQRLAGPARASSACPICGNSEPHAHDQQDIEQWASNQVARWGYKACLAPITGPEPIDALRERVKESLEGLATAQREWVRAYGWPRTEIEDVQDLFRILTAAPRPDKASVTCPEMPAWADDTDDDKPLPEDEQIDAVHPATCDNPRHDLYAEAMRLVGARRSKGGLVMLVHWLLLRIELAGQLASVKNDCRASENDLTRGYDRGCRDAYEASALLAEEYGRADLAGEIRAISTGEPCSDSATGKPDLLAAWKKALLDHEASKDDPAKNAATGRALYEAEQAVREFVRR